MADDCDDKAVLKPRKLWIESTPFSPDQRFSPAQLSPPRLRLTHFSAKAVVDFGDVKIGKTVTRKLVVENPNLYEVECHVEKFPWKKNFSITEEYFNVDEEGLYHLEILWTPKESGNYRELVMMKYDNGFRVHALILGHVNSPKKKTTARNRRRHPMNRSTRKSMKTDQPSASLLCDASYMANNSENIDPSMLENSSKDIDATSSTEKQLLVFKDVTLPQKAPAESDDTQDFSSLRNALLPMHVINGDNSRDSCGSITAPTSPSGFDAPVIDSKPSPTSTLPKQIIFPCSIESMPIDPARETFCIDPKGLGLPDRRQTDFPHPDVTGRPTYILPVAKDLEPVVRTKFFTPVKNEGKNSPRLTPRSHRRSRTFTKKALDQPKANADEKATMLDCALSVIAKPAVDDSSQKKGSTPDCDDNIQAGCNVEEGPTLVRGAVASSPSDNIKETLSSTRAHEQTNSDFIGGLPVPDISVIDGTSPMRPKKRKSSEFSPLKNATRAKKIAVKYEAVKVKASPRRKTHKGVFGTPKGRALHRRRIAKGNDAVPASPKYRTSTTKRKPNVSAAGSSKSSVVKFSAPKKCTSAMGKPRSAKKRKFKAPITRLLLKSQKSASPVPVRNPYASQNVCYDERWREKQEYVYTAWLNYILTPDEFKPALEVKNGSATGGKSKNKIVNHSQIFSQKLDKANVTVPALTKESASIRAYGIRKRLVKSRRAAMKLFTSDEFREVRAKVEKAVECAHIKLRTDRQVWADMGSKAKIIDWLMSFQPLWLRLGLEVLFDEEFVLNMEKQALGNLISRKLLNCQDIELEFAHPTVPHLFKQGYVEKISKYILKKFLILIYFLDQAKLNRLLDHDPCLFKKDSIFRNCKDILQSFSAEFLKGEGDIIKHLGYMGYRVKYQQTYIDEFEFGISNLKIDLRDGIRLVRVVELLFHQHDLTSKLRVPAGSLLQKKHNVNIALQRLQEHNVDMCDGNGKMITTDDIVKGHCEMTLALLWNIAAYFQIDKGVDQKNLEGEIEYLKKNLRLKHMMEKTKSLYDEENDFASCSKVTGVSAMLLEWCQLVCAFHSIPVYNFCGSFADGRVLACLISHYHSNLIQPSRIKMTTTMSHSDPDLNLDDSSLIQTASNDVSIDRVQLVKNEKANLKLVQRAAYEMGGIPDLLRIDDICNTIPDDKVVRLLVSYLCVRLLDIGAENRAARTIQVAWRAYKYRSKVLAEVKAAEEEKNRRIKAVVMIQALYRGYRERVQYKRLKNATIAVQRKWRRDRDAIPFRKEFLELRSAVIKMQCLYRAKIAKAYVAKLKKDQSKRNAAASVLQKFWRSCLVRMHYIKQRQSVIKIQDFYRRWLVTRTQRNAYLNYKESVCKIQEKWRATLEMRKQVAIFTTKKEAAITIQRALRATLSMKKAKNDFKLMKKAAIIIQSSYRGYAARKNFKVLKSKHEAAVVIQSKFKAHLAKKKERSRFLLVKNSAVIIKKAFRRFSARKRLQRILAENKAAVVIQKSWRATVAMKRQRLKFLAARNASVIIQTAWRSVLARKELDKLKVERRALVTIQRKWRATLLARRKREIYVRKRNAAIKIQGVFRMVLAKREFTKLKRRCDAVKIIQARWRAELEMRRHRHEFIQKRQVIIKIQSYFRCMLAKRKLQYLRLRNNAARKIQAYWKSYITMRRARNEFLSMKHSAIIIQSYFRMYQTKKVFIEKKQKLNAARIIQAKWRATLKMRSQREQYQRMKHSAIKLQSCVRREIAKKKLSELRLQNNTAKKIQAHWKGYLIMKQSRNEFLAKKKASITIQCYLRRFQAKKILFKKKQEMNAARIIQAKWRAELKMRKQRKDFVRKKEAVLKLQCFTRCMIAKKKLKILKQRNNAARKLQIHWRSFIAMKKARSDFVAKKHATVMIQCWVRRHQAKKIVEKMKQVLCSIKIIEARWKATLEMRKQREKHLSQRAAIIKLQSCTRCVLAKRTLEYLRLRNNAARRIQAYWKGFVMMKQAKLEFISKRNAAVKIQGSFKCYQAKMILLKKKLELKSVRIIQARWRAVLEMRKEREKYLTMKKAAIKIQGYWRCYFARKKLHNLKIRRDSTIVIQRKWRAMLAMRSQRSGFLEKKNACIIIQSWYRCCAAKKFLANLKRRNCAAVKIQRKWKATIKMMSERKCYLQKRKAAIKIQSSIRCALAKVKVKRMRNEIIAAKKIQNYWRGYNLMRADRNAFLQKRSSSITLQCAFRCLQAKRKLEDLRRRRDAAIMIQNKWRAMVHMRSDKAKFLEQKQACEVIQRTWRCYQARKTLEMLKIQNKSALLIQTHWKAYLDMKAQRAKYMDMRNAAVKMQSVFRCLLAKNKVCKIRRKTLAAIIIQRKWRATLLAKKFRVRFSSMKNSAVVIQSAYRSYAAKKQLVELKKRKRAACLIQSKWRATILMRKIHAQFLLQKNAAGVIQRATRVFLAKKQLNYLKARLSAAVVIQRKWKATIAMRQALALYSEERHAAVKIQCFFRRVLAEKKFSQVKSEHRAAVVIQTRWRAFLAMKNQREAFVRKKQAVIFIQSRFRGMKARKRFLDFQHRNKAAFTIQHSWRARIKMKNERLEYLLKKHAAVTIQAHFRRHVTEKQVKKLRNDHEAARIIQETWKGYTKMKSERNSYLRLKSASVVIQQRWRAWVLMKIQKEDFLKLKKDTFAAVIIQRYWKSFLHTRQERSRFLAVTRSVRTIQSFFRGYLVRKQITDSEILLAKTKCSKANKQAREHPNRKICNRMNSAMSVLLEAKAYDTVYTTLGDLYSLSLLLPYCCERIAEDGGTEVLCQLINTSNRSYHAAFVLRFCINILLNLIKNETTRYDTCQILVENNATSLELLVNILSRYRDKGSRDKSHVLVFCAACTLLIEFCRVKENVAILKSRAGKSVDMIKYISQMTAKRMKIKAKQEQVQRNRKERESIGYITMSSTCLSVCSSVINQSNILDVTTRETSFLQNMDSLRVSTPRKKYDKSEQENCDPAKKKPKEPSAKKIVTNVLGDDPTVPKMRKSLGPQKIRFHTNIPIHRAKKVTKPQSPNFQGCRSKKMEATTVKKVAKAGPLRIPRFSLEDLDDVAYDELDPESCIKTLAGFFN